MEFEISLILTSLTPAFLASIAFFRATKNSLNKQIKSQINRYIKSYSAKNYSEFSEFVFNQIFGNKIFSLRSFILSCITSMLTVFLAFWAIFGFGDVHLGDQLIRIALVIVILNFIPDFLSLCQTRAFLKYMKRRDSVGFQIFMTLIDLAASVTIILIYLSIYFFIFHEHIPLILIPNGSDIVQVVILSTLVFSVLNLVFSLPVALISKTPKKVITKYVDGPIYLTLISFSIILTSIFAVIYFVLFVVSDISIGQLLATVLKREILNPASQPPEMRVIFSSLVAFLTFLIIAYLVIVQSWQSFINLTKKSKIYRVGATFSIFLGAFFLIKIFSPTLLNETSGSPFQRHVIDIYFVPNGLPKWQVATIVNAILTLFLLIYVSSVSSYGEINSRALATMNEWFVKCLRLFSAAITLYTLSALVYISASIQWDLVPICEEWTPWQNTDGKCTVSKQKD
ncbi:MAG: hypothetical protein AAF429_06420 [Pseudomonadota bacterium]